MKKVLQLVVLFNLFLLSNIFSQGIDSQSTSTLLWEISGNGLSKPSYLYGTIHTIEKKDFFLTKSTLLAFRSCKILALEQAAFMRHYNAEAFVKIDKQKFLPKGITVSHLLTTEAFDSLTYYARKKMHVSKKAYKYLIRLKPIYISGYFMGRLYSKTTGYELAFLRQAENRNREKEYMVYEGLEEYKQTLAAIDSLDLHEQALELMSDIKTNYSQFKILVSLYKAQDIERMYHISATQHNSYRVLVINRNLNWMPKMEKLIHSQPTFIAVGAAHLAGEMGLLNLLSQRGYKVKPIIDSSPIRSIYSTTNDLY